jgi:hypothetical protein
MNDPEADKTGAPGDPDLSRYAESTRCPECGSTEIVCLSVFFEFTHLKCNRCGHDELCDMYRLDDWQA